MRFERVNHRLRIVRDIRVTHRVTGRVILRVFLRTSTFFYLLVTIWTFGTTYLTGTCRPDTLFPTMVKFVHFVTL